MLRIVFYGIFIVVVLAVILFNLYSLAVRLFDRKVKREIISLFEYQGLSSKRVVASEDLNGLPACVQKWMVNAGVVGKEIIHTGWLIHEGTMRTKEGGSWMPFQAQYYYTLDKPGFIWYADVKASPFVYLKGRDKLFKGKGNMLIKLFSLIPVVNAQGPEIDQGTMLRFLAEIIWFPSAALNEYITWENVSENSARATIYINGLSASGVFVFDDNGMPVQFTAKRYMSKNDGYSLETWMVSANDFRESNGIKAPAYIEITWDLPAGKFLWFKSYNGEIRYNQGQ